MHVVISHASKPVRKIISFDDKKTVVDLITYIMTKCGPFSTRGMVHAAWCASRAHTCRSEKCGGRYKSLFPVDVRPEHYGLVIPGAQLSWPIQYLEYHKYRVV